MEVSKEDTAREPVPKIRRTEGMVTAGTHSMEERKARGNTIAQDG